MNALGLLLASLLSASLVFVPLPFALVWAVKRTERQITDCIVCRGAGLFHRASRAGRQDGTGFFSLAISAFLLTTLDTATRLTRMTWQELQ